MSSSSNVIESLGNSSDTSSKKLDKPEIKDSKDGKKMDTNKKVIKMPVRKHPGIYSVNILTRKVALSIQEVGSNITQLLEEKLKQDYEGKCVQEGFIKSNSIRIIQYTSGMVEGNLVYFTVIFECLICLPVEGMKFKTVVKDITLAGIRSETRESYSPVDVFVARDHNYDNKRFNSVKEGDIITVRVIGHRYEINDKRIAVLADITYVEKGNIKK